MNLLLCAFVLAPPQVPKPLVLDDFTAGPWTWTLKQLNQVDHIWPNLDKRHCLFGNRAVFLAINSNPNNTTLTFSLGNAIKCIFEVRGKAVINIFGEMLGEKLIHHTTNISRRKAFFI